MNMTDDSRTILRDYYDAASSQYLNRASKGFMGWMRKRELAVTLGMIPEKGSGKALDAGCGPGYYSQILKSRGFDVTAVDISPEMVNIVQGLGFPAYVMDIEHSEPPAQLPVPFDFLFCAGVAEFAEDAVRFLKSLRSMLREDGEMVIIAPHAGAFGYFYKRFLVAKGIPAQVYTKQTMASFLRVAGFEPIEMSVVWPICLSVRAKAI
jgi:2-polyprenyl-3-methyl-5-hydroxy-6-metoxy-1,4-benzoquinol methylase